MSPTKGRHRSKEKWYSDCLIPGVGVKLVVIVVPYDGRDPSRLQLPGPTSRHWRHWKHSRQSVCTKRIVLKKNWNIFEKLTSSVCSAQMTCTCLCSRSWQSCVNFHYVMLCRVGSMSERWPCVSDETSQFTKQLRKGKKIRRQIWKKIPIWVSSEVPLTSTSLHLPDFDWRFCRYCHWQLTGHQDSNKHCWQTSKVFISQSTPHVQQQARVRDIGHVPVPDVL